MIIKCIKNFVRSPLKLSEPSLRLKKMAINWIILYVDTDRA